MPESAIKSIIEEPVIILPIPQFKTPLPNLSLSEIEKTFEDPDDMGSCKNILNQLYDKQNNTS
jgi:hypothetical protein